MKIAPKARKLILALGLLLLLAIAVPAVLMGGYAAGLVFLSVFPPKPEYTLTVHNRGEIPIVGGYLAGDSLWRPVGRIRPGRATAFVFVGCGGRDDADYRLHLVRSDSSRVTVEVGWITGDWSLSTLSHDAAVIVSDTSRSVGLVLPMDKQNQLMADLRSKLLIDQVRP